MECSSCSRSAIERQPLDGFVVEQIELGIHDWVCSPSCLVEFAWKLKEAQPKLSKSRSEG